VYLGPGDDAFFRSYGSFARVHGGPGNDFIEAGNDDMVIRGGQGDDFLLVTESEGSVIRGGPGNDEIYQWSSSGTNRIYGGPGGDRLNIGLGSATVLGGLGPDLIVNSQHGEPSVLRGGSGQDWIQSVAGDTVRGGPGVDTCTGRACEIEPDVGERPDFARPIAWWN
jgi:Ca2+-binding RTX toxin-like protein